MLTEQERESTRLLREACLIECGHECSVPGCKAPAEAHHIGGKRNSMRWHWLGWIGLCAYHHKHAKDFAPHRNEPRFLEWLGRIFPAKFRFYTANRWKVVQDREIDHAEIQRRVKRRIRYLREAA